MLTDLLTNNQKILAECAIAERLRRDPGIALHPTLYNTPLIYGPDKPRRKMTSLYQEIHCDGKRSGATAAVDGTDLAAGSSEGGGG